MQDHRENKETFKLLQLSDDSKSLSDLELPEIATQRKRKVRRKTRPRPATHRQNEEMTSDNQCNRLIIWIAIFLISCWLLTLSYMLAVIHAESTRLEVQIKKANKKTCAGNGIHSQDQLLSPSTDEQDDITWPKVVRTSHRSRHRKFSFLQTCIPVIFVISVAFSLGFVYWLHFDLKQQLYDYRSRIEEVALSSQNVPDALQKWHETSKSLEQNQTLLAGKLLEIHNYIEELRGRFSVYEEKLNEKKDYPKDEHYVANFGAEVKAVSADVEHIKDKLLELQKGQTDFRNEIETLKTNFSETVKNATRRANNNETDFSDELKKAQTLVFNEIKSLSANVSTINDTLSQKTKILSEDQRGQQAQIETMSNTIDNITSHVNSIDMNWNQNKLIASDFESFKNNSNNELQSLKNATIDLKNNIENVRLDCSKVKSDILQTISNSEIKEAKTAKKDSPHLDDPIQAVLGGDTDTPIKAVSPNSDALQSQNTVKTTAGTTITQPTKPSSATTESSTVVVTVAEGKPKLLSIQTISKPV